MCCATPSNENVPCTNAWVSPSFHGLPLLTFSTICDDTSCQPSSVAWIPSAPAVDAILPANVFADIPASLEPNLPTTPPVACSAKVIAKPVLKLSAAWSDTLPSLARSVKKFR